ncbi:MAG: mannose-6-phosphate isomerase, class I [Deltaproteobacteria bacterium]|nr:mannose-6-phosphate isomerase, class I [Deltaproteobacteria bacterium]
MLSLPHAQPLLLRPQFQKYAWGDERFLPAFFGLANVQGPHAEAWIGAHPSLASTAVLGGEREPLDELLKRRPDLLGDDLRAKFGGLPYLFKVLAAAHPLSIQVHPDRHQASTGFSREVEVGLAADSVLRNYKDTRHKPELLVALVDFFVLVGFRPLDEIGRVLLDLPEARGLLPAYTPTPSGLRRLVQGYLSLPVATCASLLESLLARLQKEHLRSPFRPEDHAYWVLVAHQVLSGTEMPDRGLFLIFLLNLIRLRPGQGVFVPAGVPHAYLRGAGVEVMANSDNVLRGGLTPKHVDTSELMKVARFVGETPSLIIGEATDRPEERVFRTPAQEFELRRIDLSAGAVSGKRSAVGPEILLVAFQDIEARVTVEFEAEVEPDAGVGAHLETGCERMGGEGRLELRRGSACFIPNGVSYRLRADDPAVIYAVRTPRG